MILRKLRYIVLHSFKGSNKTFFHIIEGGWFQWGDSSFGYFKGQTYHFI